MINFSGMRWTEDLRSANRILVGEPEGHKPVAMPKCRIGYNIQIDFIEWGVRVRTGLIWLRTRKSDNRL